MRREAGRQHLSVSFFFDGRFEPGPARPETHAHRRHEIAFSLFRGGHDLARLGRGSRKRLFAKDMFPRVEGRDRRWSVQVSGNAHVHQVHVGIGQHIVESEVGLHLFHIELHGGRVAHITARIRKHALHGLADRVTHGHQPGVPDLLVGANVHDSHETQADDTDIDFVATHSF